MLDPRDQIENKMVQDDLWHEDIDIWNSEDYIEED